MRIADVKSILFALAAVAVMSTSAVALADAAYPTTDHAQAATILCRPAGADERATAMTDGKARLVCKNIDGAGLISGKGCPKVAGHSAEQVNEAWRALVYSALMIRSGDG
jgi:hypothetical protein